MIPFRPQIPCDTEIMLAHDEVEELARLRRAAYGPEPVELAADTLTRLSELEASARVQDLTSDDPDIASEQAPAVAPDEFRDTETNTIGESGERRHLPTWLIPVLIASGFAVGVIVGVQPEWLSMSPPSPTNAGRELSAEESQSHDRVIATQRWDDPEQVKLASGVNHAIAWTGFMADGDDYCVAIDEKPAITLLCQRADDPDAYPLRFDWVSPNSGLSLHHMAKADGSTTTTMGLY